MKNWRIKYTVICESGPLKDKECVIKNQDWDIGAKCKLEDICRKKYPDFKELKIESCQDNNIYEAFGGIFGDIFSCKY